MHVYKMHFTLCLLISMTISIITVIRLVQLIVFLDARKTHAREGGCWQRIPWSLTICHDVTSQSFPFSVCIDCQLSFKVPQDVKMRTIASVIHVTGASCIHFTIACSTFQMSVINELQFVENYVSAGRSFTLGITHCSSLISCLMPCLSLCFSHHSPL